MAGNLTGSFHVRVIRPAFDDANRLMRRVRDRMELRRHALKLRYWPDAVTTESSGLVVDLDWSWIEALSSKKVGELRINDVIGGHNNLRIIFHVGPPPPPNEMRCVWILAAMQKKRDDFTTHNIATFRARRLLVRTRFYGEID